MRSPTPRPDALLSESEHLAPMPATPVGGREVGNSPLMGIHPGSAHYGGPWKLAAISEDPPIGHTPEKQPTECRVGKATPTFGPQHANPIDEVGERNHLANLAHHLPMASELPQV